MKRVHLLRQFTGWMDDTITTIEGAEEWIAEIAEHEDAYFYTPSLRHPRRVEDLEAGGSIYFCKNRKTLFRMPNIRIRTKMQWCFICADPKIIRVEQKHVGFVRGWRYLEDADKPQDLTLPEDIPDDIDERLDALGVR